MLGGVTHHMLPHLPGVPHLHVNRPEKNPDLPMGKIIFVSSLLSLWCKFIFSEKKKSK